MVQQLKIAFKIQLTFSSGENQQEQKNINNFIS